MRSVIVFFLQRAIFISLSMSFVQSVTAQQSSMVRVTLIDNQNNVISGVALMVEDSATGATLSTITDSRGEALLGPFPPTSMQIIITGASYQGSPLTIEPTTLTELRIGLIPGYERPVLLSLRDSVLALAPESLFSGVNEQGAPNPLTIPTPYPDLDYSLSESLPGSPSPMSAVPDELPAQPLQVDITETPLEQDPGTPLIGWLLIGCGVGLLLLIMIVMVRRQGGQL